MNASWKRSIRAGVVSVAIAGFVAGWGGLLAGDPRVAPKSTEANPDVPLKARKYKDKFKDKGGPTSAEYSLDLVSLDSRKIWYQTIGNHDLVILNLWAYDTGRASEHAQFVSTAYKARSGQRQSLGFTKLFGAFPDIKGELKIGGTLVLAHPQNFRNVRDAMRRMVELETGVVGMVIRMKEIEGLTQIFGNTDTLEKIQQFQADLRYELINALGKVISLGQNDCRTYVAPIEITLSKTDLQRHANEEFRLWYAVKGAKAATCWREIKYDLIARALRD